MSVPNKRAADIRSGKALPELLCPAGSYDALCAAIEGGADAVYMGGVAFNARINAKNFTEDELRRGIALAHNFGVKVYIAANTLIYDRELDGFLRAAEHAYLCGADALIVADVGAAAAVQSRMDIELHASTQISGHNVAMAEKLAHMGFSRMVCAREMSREDIRRFIDGSHLESEVFVHGALCVCHSGQCLFSSLVGGRSGNRGECAQPCRLPFKVGQKQQYPLSLKDLTLACHVTELCDMGVCSLKIEGRMKSPEYVYNVTRIWRRLLDSKRNAAPEEIRELESVFSRGGFTDGYFTGRIGKGMMGVRSDEQKQVTRELANFKGITRKIPIHMEMTLKADEPVKLTLRRKDGCAEVTVCGDVPQAARTAPLDSETVKRSLLKLGDTAFCAESVDIYVDEGIMLPISALNSVRRKAVEELNCAMLPVRLAKFNDVMSDKPEGERKNMRTATFYKSDSIPSVAHEYFDIIYLPLEKYDGSVNGVALPAVIFDSERDKVAKMLEDARRMGAEHVLVGNIGHLDIIKSSGLVPHGDFRLNVCNNQTATFMEKLGFVDVVLSPELSLAQIRDIGGSTSVCVYGKMPLMITEKCVGKQVADCSVCESEQVKLTDRRGVTFPVLRTFEHRSVIFNSVPFYMADRHTELERFGIKMKHFIFSDETKEQVERIIRAYANKLPPADASKIKRIK